MSLQRKFAILLGLLGLTVALSLGTAVWSLRLMQREVTTPIADIASVLTLLSDIRQDLSQRTAAPPAVGDEADEQFKSRSLERLARLDATQSYIKMTGVNTSRQLRERVERVIDLAGSPDEDAKIEVDRAIRFITHIQRRVAEGAQLASEQGDELRHRLGSVLAASLATASLVGALGFLLLRRWVVQPVAAIRRATERIAAGDFKHRAPVRGHDEMAKLSAEINHMAAMVATMQEERVEQERLAAMGEMVRRIAHNLRNPLSGIRSLAELTRDELPPSEELRENQDRIIAAVDRFEQWLGGLLSATSPLELHREPLRARSWLEGVVETHRPVAESLAVELELDASGAPEEACFDAWRLEQALVAVVTNAIEASPRGARVEIQATTSPRRDQWEIRVADQGVGVAPGLTERIFEAHFTSKTGGNGIGLAVAQRVVREHGGRITVEDGLTIAGGGVSASGNGHGAAFVLRLPLDRAHAAPRSLYRPDGANGEL